MSQNDWITQKDRKGLLFLSLFMIALFCFLIIQFFRIQIIEGEKWTREARKQHFFSVKEPFLRGTFYSNTSIKRGHPEKPQPFAMDILKFHLYIDPGSIPEEYRDPITAYLNSFLDLSVEEKIRLREQFDIKSRSRKLAMWLDRETRDSVMEWWFPYARERKIPRNAIFFVNDYQRSYPFGKLLGQVLHTVQKNKEERTDQAVPTGGLELYFNQYLKGKPGKRLLMRSPRNSFEMGKVIAPPEHGSDVYLTVNHYLQAIAEEEIAKGVQKAKAKSGWAVMMDPTTGEILAIAQYPFFYPPEYQLYFNDPQLMDYSRVKAVTDANEPGSVMKAVTIAIALKANEELKARGEKLLFNPEEKMATSNSHFNGRKKPLRDTHFHAFLNMNMALQKSSNIYMGRLVEGIIAKLGAQWYRSALNEIFGFGKKTKIELPSESRGLLPTPGKKHPNGAFEWSPATPYSLAMGHNIQTNSIQLLRAYAVFANGGYLVEPTLVRKIVKRHLDGTQEILLDNTMQERLSRFPRVLSTEITQQVVRAMKYVTKPGGAASRANIPGFTEAGKTGTAEKIVNGLYVKNIHCSSFIGFAPVEHPAFVLLVTIDEPEAGFQPGVGKIHHGGACAAPVFREIGKRSLEYLGIELDDPHGYPNGDPRYHPDKADWVKETRLLKEMYETWNNKTQSSGAVR